LADLAVSCEYLTSDKLCLAVSESPKAKAARQVRCENYEKMSCCYVCLFKRKCGMGCTYLGNFENDPQQIRDEKNEADNAPENNERNKVAKTEKVSTVFCSLCNHEMCQTKTKIRIEGWAGLKQETAGDNSEKPSEESLPVIVYLCPKCGKVEFAAEGETKQKLLSQLSKANNNEFQLK
jgi:hypothetical protein